MKILLEGKVLAESKKYEIASKVIEERRKRLNERGEIDWVIYTWNSKDKLGFDENGSSYGDKNSIFVGGYDYPAEGKDFLERGLKVPEQIIRVSSVTTPLEIHYSSMKKMIDILESKKIDCLLSSDKDNPFDAIQYLSPKIEKDLYGIWGVNLFDFFPKKRLDVEKVEL